MAVTIKAYQYSGYQQVIKKQIGGAVWTAEGVFRQPFSLLNPVFQVTGEQIQSRLLSGTANYFEIENKFYYMQDYRLLANGLVELNLKLDTLYTYRNEIVKMTVMLERSTNGYYEPQSGRENPVPYMTDPMLPVTNMETFEEIDFPNSFSDKEADGGFILVTAQSGYTSV